MINFCNSVVISDRKFNFFNVRIYQNQKENSDFRYSIASLLDFRF
jgi:hypothetical protein